MNIDKVKNETVEVLECSLDELGYITDDLLRENEIAEDADLSSGDALGRKIRNRWGTFCIRVIAQGNYLYYTSSANKKEPDAGYYICKPSLKRFRVKRSNAKYHENTGQHCSTDYSEIIEYIGNYKGGSEEFGMSEIKPEDEN
jgi:hypothetical protein